VTDAELELLKIRRAAVVAQLSAMTSTSIGGKPDAGGGGEAVQHVQYKDALYRELENIDRLIERATPWEITS
jgi:hypothetical protein